MATFKECMDFIGRSPNSAVVVYMTPKEGDMRLESTSNSVGALQNFWTACACTLKEALRYVEADRNDPVVLFCKKENGPYVPYNEYLESLETLPD